MPDYEYLVEHVGPHGFVVQQPVPGKAHAERFAAKQPYDGRFPRILRREVGRWAPAPAEETSAEAERAFMACPMTHLPEMACGTCGKPAEGADHG